MSNIIATSSDNATSNAELLFNDFSSNNIIDITLTADNAAGTAAVSEIFLLAGTGIKARKTLPAGVTVTGGDYAGADAWEELQDYFRNTAMEIVGISLQTSDTANYSSKIVCGDMTPNKQNLKLNRIELSQYRESVGGGYADNLDMIAGQNNFKPIYTMPNTFMSLTLRKNGWMRIIIKIGRAQVAAPLNPVSF